MPKYHYSVIRFVPSPTRGEFVNLGIIVGSDATDEWTMELVGKKSRAAKFDEAGILPLVSSELERLQLRFPIDDDDDMRLGNGPEINEAWLREISAQSRNVVQYTAPQPLLALDAAGALEKLWDIFVVEPESRVPGGVLRRTVVAKCWNSFESRLGKEHVKKRIHLETGSNRTDIDIAIHNGVVKQLTQCWSFQVKDTDKLLNDVKAWGWTMRGLRNSGGRITGSGLPIDVPADVRLRVVYAPQVTEDDITKRAIDVFNDHAVGALCATMDHIDAEATAAAELL